MVRGEEGRRGREEEGRGGERRGSTLVFILFYNTILFQIVTKIREQREKGYLFRLFFDFFILGLRYLFFPSILRCIIFFMITYQDL